MCVNPESLQSPCTAEKRTSQREYIRDDTPKARSMDLGVDKDSVRIDVQMNESRLIVQER
jgi:hypothetical protein